jgi:hypothetical protein
MADIPPHGRTTYGPVRQPKPFIDAHTYWETLQQFPGNRWTLLLETKLAGGNQTLKSDTRGLSPTEASEWFLRNRLEVPGCLYEVLAPLPEQRPTDKPETRHSLGLG